MKKSIVVLFTQRDIKNFLRSKLNHKDIFIFCPFSKKDFDGVLDRTIHSNHNKEKLMQMKTLSSARKIKVMMDKFSDEKKISKHLLENINSIYFIMFFSLFSIANSLKNFQNFIVYEEKKKNWKKYDTYNDFVSGLHNYLTSKNVDFYQAFDCYNSNFLDYVINYINKKLLNLFSSNSFTAICGPRKLYKKISELNRRRHFLVFVNNNKFKFYHLFLNVLNILPFKKKIFFYSPLNYKKQKKLLDELDQIKNLLFKIKIKNTKNIQSEIDKIILKYCQNQIFIKNDIDIFLKNFNIGLTVIDQARFDTATIVADKFFNDGKDVILFPHGSMSKPNNEITNFIYKISSRGFFVSKIVTHVVSQSKVSYDAIRFFDKNIKILKSEKIMYGEGAITFKKNIREKKLILLHASTPKAFYKWPWIHETYSEYVENLKRLITILKKYENIKLIIRFRESQECDLENLSKILDIKKNIFVKISRNKDFFSDFQIADCLISFSSTVIEESLSYNRPTLIFSGSKNYKHINYKFNSTKVLHFANENNIDNYLNKICTNRLSFDKCDINWNFSDLHNKNSLKQYFRINE